MIPVNEAHMYVAAATHPGMKGKNNEDRYAVSAHILDEEANIPSVLAVICDGIGGHRAGEVAAEIAVESICHTVAESNGKQPLEVLAQAYANANQAIHAQASNDPAQRGMGATGVTAWIIGKRLYTASMGDSRLYFARGNTILQLTTDHTWIQEAIEFGALTPQQAIGHPNAHVIRRYLGAQNPMTPDFRLRLQPDETDEQSDANQGMRLLPGDRLLLCSDGLTDLVSKEEILGAISGRQRNAALDYLIDLANSRGGHDNITIVSMEVPPDEDITQPVRPQFLKKERPNSRLRNCLGILLLLALLALLGILLWKFFGNRFKSGPVSPPVVSPVITRIITTPGLQGFRRATPSAGEVVPSFALNRSPLKPPAEDSHPSRVVPPNPP